MLFRSCVAVGGGVLPEGDDALAALGAVALPVVEGPTTLEAAIAEGAAPLERTAARIARLVGFGRQAES